MNIKSLVSIFAGLFYTGFSFGQIVFSETFDEAENAEMGTDAIGPTDWSTACGGCMDAADYFKVRSGKLEAQDTNGPGAIWTTDAFDVTICDGLEIAFELSQAGDMEGCADCGGTGSICIDWVKLEYNLDGAGWTEVAGSTCPLAFSPGELIQVGDILGGGPITYTSPCIDFGTTLQLRISCQCWAASEKWLFDDITVSCNDCVLPVEVTDFAAVQTSNGTTISWRSLSERSTAYFLIEKSYDGELFETIKTVPGATNSSTEIYYEIQDNAIMNQKLVYYKLSQFDFDGNQYPIDLTTLNHHPTTTIFYANQTLNYTIEASEKTSFHLNIYNGAGQLVEQKTISESGSTPWNQSGFYLVQIPELNYHQKLTVP